jgi:hypothetical protein
MNKTKKKFIFKKEWEEFRKTGLLWLTNTILQVFGWSLVVTVNTETNEILNAYPARNKYRGFDKKSIHQNVGQIYEYLENNLEDIKEDLKC